MIAAAIALAGIGLVSTLSRPRNRAELWLHAALALLLGLGCASAAWSAGLIAFHVAGAASDLFLAGLGAALLAVTRGRGWRLEAAGGRRSPPWELLAGTTLAALVVSGLFVEHSIRYPDGNWDATAVYNVRARALARAPERLDLVFASELPHADYPVLVPALVGHSFRALSTESPTVAVVLHGLFGVLAVVLPALAAAAARGAGAGLIAALALLGTPALMTFTWTQIADVPFAALFAGALIVAGHGAFALAGLCVGLALWTKNEGLLALFAIGTAVAIHRGIRPALRLAAGAAPLLALFVAFKFRWAPPNDYGSALTLAGLREHLTDLARYRFIAGQVAARLWRFEDWALALDAATLAWAILAVRKRGPAADARVAATACALLLAAYLAVYATTPLELEWHVRGSIDRLFFHVWPAAVWATVLSLFPAAMPADAAQAAPR